MSTDGGGEYSAPATPAVSERHEDVVLSEPKVSERAIALLRAAQPRSGEELGLFTPKLLLRGMRSI